MLPSEFGPWQTVYWWFGRFVRRMLFRTIHDVALMLDRDNAGREASPTGGVIDSQTVKAPFVAPRGYDGGKKIVGRKRHVAVDSDGAQLILDGVRKRWPWLKHPFVNLHLSTRSRLEAHYRLDGQDGPQCGEVLT